MAPEELPKFDTPLPGQIIAGTAAEKVVSDFLRRFRKGDPRRVPSNLPTACVVEGHKDKNILKSPNFLAKQRVFFFLDPDPPLLYSADPSSVLKYLAIRQPWEDYDICLFDESLDWCIGITHNDDVIVSDVKGVLG